VKQLFLMLFAACASASPSPVVVTHPNDPALCAEAGAHVCALPCPALCTTPAGTPFADVCASATYPWHMREIIAAPTCLAVDRAYRGEK
jgi:hypothetical protein